VKLKRLEEPATGRKRLTNRTQRLGSQTGLPTWGAFLFGTVFVAAGTFLALAGMGVIPVKSSSVHAPFWILTVCGAVFAVAGMMVWGMAVKQFRARSRAARVRLDHPELSDHDWDIRGCEAARWSKAIWAIGGSLFLSVFLSIFNWWAFWANGPWLVKAIVTVFDLVILLAWWYSLLLLGRALKFGGSRIVFQQFPYPLSEPVVIHWMPARGIEQASKGSFTLRCVEEWMEERGSGDDRSTSLVHEEIWRQTWLLDETRRFRHGEQIEIAFDKPTDCPATCLSADRPIFWEFEVKLELPGFDFHEMYLVPIYE
jgi:hypothetical protein